MSDPVTQLVRSEVQTAHVPPGDLTGVAARARQRVRRRRGGMTAVILAAVVLGSVAVERVLVPSPPVIDQAPGVGAAPASQPGPAGTLIPVFAAPASGPTQQWSTLIEGTIADVAHGPNAILLLVDGFPYDDSDDDRLEARDPDSGELRWTRPVESASAGRSILDAVTVSDTLVVTIYNDMLRSVEMMGLDPRTGDVLWDNGTTEPGITMPVPIGAGLVAVADMESDVVRAYHARSGEVAWQTDATDTGFAQEAVAIVDGSELRVLETDGTVRWQAAIPPAAEGPRPVTIHHGLVVVAAGEALIAHDVDDGTPVWTTDPGMGPIGRMWPVPDVGFGITNSGITTTGTQPRVGLLRSDGEIVTRTDPIEVFWTTVNTQHTVKIVTFEEYTLPSGDVSQSLALLDLASATRTDPLPPPAASPSGGGYSDLPAFHMNVTFGVNATLNSNGLLVADGAQIALHDFEALEARWSMELPDTIIGMQATAGGLLVGTVEPDIGTTLSLLE